MEQSIRNLRIGLGIAVLIALSVLILTGGIVPSHLLEKRGPACTQADSSAMPGFGAFPPGGVPACIRLRIG
jgi:hypothetical protein